MVVYDHVSDDVHYITDDTVRVWRALPGTPAVIAGRLGIAASDVEGHLAVLAERGLVTPGGGVSRKLALSGLAAGGLAAAIWSMKAPTPAAASSTIPED